MKKVKSEGKLEEFLDQKAKKIYFDILEKFNIRGDVTITLEKPPHYDSSNAEEGVFLTPRRSVEPTPRRSVAPTKIKRRSIREVIENPQPNEYYVLITRYYPMELRKRGMKLRDTPIDDWDRDLAPSRELLKTFKKNGDWGGYVKAFFEEKPDELIRQRLNDHLDHAKQKKLVLVCIEEANKYPQCHTWLLLEKARELGVVSWEGL